ncbi:hypothetical protein [Actinomadura sp. 21ATH]|uniref:hypothetical protein n=1 Tax=Actinomadura sp. 21ATH TaxID=1735444 RepID=UPI0035BFA527
MTAAARPHGYARYRLDGCRCYTCAAAVHAYDQHRARAIAYGTWHPFVDAEPARAHVRALLAAGLGTRSIAAAAGVPRQSIQYLLRGRPRGGGPAQPPPERIRPATAAAILSVDLTLDRLPPATRIDATGTRRRVHALAVAGWPHAQVAAHIGTARGNLTAAIKQPRVTVATALKVRAACRALWGLDPASHGVAPHRVEATRRRAQQAGWAPLAAWDDIDDPAERPQGIREEAAA